MRTEQQQDVEASVVRAERPVLLRKVSRPDTANGVLRERLLTAADRAAALVIIVGPAGSGKTTLMSQTLARRDGARLWLRADATDRSPVVLLRSLRAAGEAAGLPTSDWTDVDRMACAWESVAPVTLALDDLHTLDGSDSMRTLVRMLDYLPVGCTVLATSRHRLDPALARLHMAGNVAVVDADDLRFRTWEVERLYRDVYGRSFPPEELALLARRTQGWAAGLQLYHLATSSKSRRERQRVLDGLRGASTLLRSYLAADVLDDLPDDLRRFLLDTCILGTLTPGLCDELTGRHGSGQLLQQLVERHIFTSRVDDAPTYRYHDVLRGHLEAVLIDEIGEEAARKRYLVAGELLDGAGHVADALRAFSHAEAWDTVGDIVRRGSGDAARTGEWIDQLPDALVREEPWLVLARARHQVASGEFDRALRSYREVERAGGGARLRELAVREQRGLAAWVQNDAGRGRSGGPLRSGTRRQPLAAVPTTGVPGFATHATTIMGLALLGGDARRAGACAAAVLDDPSARPESVAFARVATVVAGFLGGRPAPREDVVSAADALERAGQPWLARMVSTGLALCDPPDVAAATTVGLAFQSTNNHWAVGVAGLAEGIGLLRVGEDATAPLTAAVSSFRACGAPVPELWTNALLAATVADPQAADTALDHVAARARALDVPGVEVLVAALRHGGPSEESAARAETLGMDPAFLGSLRRKTDQRTAQPTVRIDSMGTFAVVVDGVPVDLQAWKPQVRLGLQYFVAHAGQPVHREALGVAFWPDADQRAMVRNVQVMVSAIRSCLAEIPGLTIERRERSYRLVVDDRVAVSHLVVLHELEVAALAHWGRERDNELVALTAAVGAYRGPLLADRGAVEWVLGPRDELTTGILDAADRIAELLLEDADHAGAVRVVRRGLQVNPSHDPLWRRLLHALAAAGDTAALQVERRRYGDVLRGLGLHDDEIDRTLAEVASVR